MKFLSTILLCVSFLFTQAQIRQSIGGSPKVRSFVQGTIEGDTGIVLRTSADTALLNVGNFTKKINSLLVRVGDKLAFRDTLTKQWIFVKGGLSSTDTALISKIVTDSSKIVSFLYPVVITKINDSSFQWKLTQGFIDSALANATGVTPNITWSVLDSISTPPTPQVGNSYLVGTNPTGVFAGNPNKIATYDSTLAYTFETPSMGDLLYNATNSFVSQWNGTNWIRVTVNNFVHITGRETIIGKKTFLDTLLLSGAKGIKLYSIPNANVNFLETVSQGTNYPWLSIRGQSSGSKIIMGANNPGSAADAMRLIADYTDSIWTGTYRPLYVDVFENLTFRVNRGGIVDTAIRFSTGANKFNYVGHFSNTGKYTLNKYGSASAFKSSDTTINKPLGVDATGNLVRMNNWGGGTGSSGRFGIEDNVGVQDRNISMNNHSLNIINASTLRFATFGYPLSNYLNIDNNTSALFSADLLTGATTRIEVGNKNAGYKYDDGSGNIVEQHFVSKTGVYNIPISVQANGTEVFADSTGKVNLGTIGGSSSPSPSITGEEHSSSTAATITLSQTPITGTIKVYKNGIRLPASQYALATNVVTLTAARVATDIFIFDFNF